MKIELEVKEGIHISPKWYNLNFGGFQRVAVCEDCNLHISNRDINPYAPCPNCGGYFSGLKEFSGIFIKGKWCKRIAYEK